MRLFVIVHFLIVCWYGNTIVCMFPERVLCSTDSTRWKRAVETQILKLYLYVQTIGQNAEDMLPTARVLGFKNPIL